MGENYGIADQVEPIDVQNASQLAKMKEAEVPLLSEVEATSLTAVEQHVDDAFSINYPVFFRIKLK